MRLVKFLLIVLFLISSVSSCVAYDRGAPGKDSTAPQFSLKSLDGDMVALADYREKKAVLLMFWTTWCPYCRIALRSLKEEAGLLESMNLEVVTVNAGEPEYKVKSFIKELGLNFAVLLDLNAQVSDSYELLGVPTYFVIDRRGIIVFKGNRFSTDKLKGLVLE